jgi:PAS domain S-box-containing protein
MDMEHSAEDSNMTNVPQDAPPLPEGATAVEREYHEFRWNLPDALVEGDLSSFRVTFMNRMAFIIFGYTPEDLAAGISGPQLFAPEDLPRVMQQINAHAAASRSSGQPHQRSGSQDLFEQRQRRKNGTIFWTESQNSFVLDDGGVPVLMRSLIRDISDRRAAELERERMLKELETALASVQQLHELLPLCPTCHRIELGGEWTEIEKYALLVARKAAFEPACPECKSRARRQIAG